MVRKWWILILVLLLVALGVGWWMSRPQQPPTVQTTVLKPTQVEHTISCNGVVEAADGVGVFAPVSCYIREVKVAVGQRVKKGDVLAVIDKTATLSDAADIAMQVALAAMEEELVAPADGIIIELSAEVLSSEPI